ncbi:unnamed protein product [Prorocentrum cordatum]|uniref:Uncharacterized protein n=1 Tax=Prorocentrum cordatum TaxID=2364126 RepID=A0ABN9RG77_9DINO|nr:unnamed protein product [Polarella glacialis]
MYGDDLTGYDFLESIKTWMRQSRNEAWSLAEVLLARGRSGVGMAALFISHIQAQSLEETLNDVPDEVNLWLDYTTLRQCRDDFDPDRICSTIRYISKVHQGTFAIVDEPTLSYLSRSFCIFEVACTEPTKLRIQVSQDTTQMVMDRTITIDAKKADARNKKHKGYVDGFIVGKWGGFAAFNKSVSEAFAAAHIQQLFVARNKAAVAGLSRLQAHDSGTVRERAVGALSMLAEEGQIGGQRRPRSGTWPPRAGSGGPSGRPRAPRPASRGC